MVKVPAWSIQQIRNYTEFRSKDKKQLLKSIQEFIGNYLKNDLPHGNFWHFHPVRKFYLLKKQFFTENSCLLKHFL